MQVVGGFVGFGADEAGRTSLMAKCHWSRETSLRCRAKRGLGFGVGRISRTISTAADEVFPEAGLGFVNAERNRFAERRAPVIGGEALRVEGVAGFVKDAEEGVAEVLFVVAGGHADVVRAEVGAEGVDGDVEPAGVEIEADLLGSLRGPAIPGRRRDNFARIFQPAAFFGEAEIFATRSISGWRSDSKTRTRLAVVSCGSYSSSSTS